VTMRDNWWQLAVPSPTLLPLLSNILWFIQVMDPDSDFQLACHQLTKPRRPRYYRDLKINQGVSASNFQKQNVLD
jgi:hypothetical protein